MSPSENPIESFETELFSEYELNGNDKIIIKTVNEKTILMLNGIRLYLRDFSKQMFLMIICYFIVLIILQRIISITIVASGKQRIGLSSRCFVN